MYTILQEPKNEQREAAIKMLDDARVDWTALSEADPEAVQRLTAAWPIRLPSFVYDAKTVCEILGLPCDCTVDAPKAAPGEVVVWYGGWTLGELVMTGKVANYLSKEWEAWKAPPGYYHIQVLLPDSNRMTHDAHIDLLTRLYAALKELPTVVGAVALATHFGVTGEDLLKRNFCACAEALQNGYHAALGVREGRVNVSYWGGHGGDDVFLGAARKSES